MQRAIETDEGFWYYFLWRKHSTLPETPVDYTFPAKKLLATGTLWSGKIN
jgi:hypothetical protein